MSSRLIIRIAPDAGLSWLIEDSAGQFSPVQAGDIGELRRAAPARLRHIDVLVPGEAVLLLEANIPARSQASLRQALPFAVEENLLDGVENYHLALGRKLADQRYLVAAVSKVQMQQWVDLLDELPGQLRAFVPDSLAVPATDGIHIWCESGRTLLRHSDVLGFVGNDDEVRAVLDLSRPDGTVSVSEWAGATDWAGQRLATSGDALTTLTRTVAEQPAVNLLQGAFNTEQERATRAWGWLRYAAMIAALAAGVELANRGWQVHQAKQQFARSTDQSEQIFRQTFPEVQRVVNARAQMQQQLTALGGSAANSGGFLGLLRRAGPALSGSAITIDDMNYRDGALELRVVAADYESIEQVSQQLIQRQLNSAVGQVMTLGDGSSAQLRIAESKLSAVLP